MSDDRTLAPSAARQRRAWRAGLRPSSRALLPAAACGLLALALDGTTGEVGTWVQPGAVSSESWLGAVARVLGIGWLVAAAVVLGLAALTRRLGVVAASDRRRLRPAPARPLGLLRIALGLGLGAVTLAAVSGVLAGAARGVDASEASLGTLWLGWATTLAITMAAVLGLGALVELVVDRHERVGRLFLDHAGARELARDAGGRAR